MSVVSQFKDSLQVVLLFSAGGANHTVVTGLVNDNGIKTTWQIDSTRSHNESWH